MPLAEPNFTVMPDVTGGTLVIRGAETTDDLTKGGLPLASMFHSAETVVLIPDEAAARVVKGGHQHIVFVDLDGRMSEMANALGSIKYAWEQEYPKHPEDAPWAVGMFLFYWVAGEPAQMIWELFASGEVAQVKAAAEDFIERKFNGLTPRTDRVHEDVSGRGKPAEAHVSTDAVPRAHSSG